MATRSVIGIITLHSGRSADCGQSDGFVQPYLAQYIGGGAHAAGAWLLLIQLV